MILINFSNEISKKRIAKFGIVTRKKAVKRQKRLRNTDQQLWKPLRRVNSRSCCTFISIEICLRVEILRASWSESLLFSDSSSRSLTPPFRDIACFVRVLPIRVLLLFFYGNFDFSLYLASQSGRALRPRLKISGARRGSRESTTATVAMEELYKIGERTQQAQEHEVEMSDFEKKLNFTQKQQEEFTESGNLSFLFA